MSDLPEYVLERLFNAPRELVWKAWTKPEILQRWYGPNVETIIHEFDLQPGGCWRNEMRWGGKGNFSCMLFQEVKPPEKLVWHHASTDEDWNTVANPMMPDWPRVLLTTVTFEDQGDQTSVRLSQIPLDASAAEIECFANAMAGLDNGWGKGYAILDEVLTEL